MAEKIDLKRIARELNLAVSTVSRALRDSYEISEETKQKVFALAQQLNYEPNPYASSLRRQKSKTIGVVLPELPNNFFTHVVNGIEWVARQKGYHVLIYITHEQVEQEISLIRHLQSGRVDGVLASVCAGTQDIAHFRSLQQHGIPLVFFDRVCEDSGFPTVTTNDYEASYNATVHLIQQGCRHLYHLTLPLHLSIARKRLQGFLDALRQYQLPIEASTVLIAKDIDQFYDQLEQLLCSAQPPDGIFAAVEKLVLQVYHICQKRHICIPHQLKVLAFSNLETAPLLAPPLTTITQPAFEIGKKAAELLFRKIEKKRDVFEQMHYVIPSALVIRDSTRILGPSISKEPAAELIHSA
ncbi:LacI family transcriptional regulator [Thermoflavifilum aggregans]|uniref:LacI family transcriptional regulator n=1 Tax=Thermoflavifilum aggregans TaxID=454188 RepID=A0A2M9CV28_9BACT|nr:LacI family DNA-binding transcriptional regulator [Thermoflavifilum aggregans]PJJ75739.1 LacI family transcriptional regulator [Thermoflavifilum aggregans]